MRRRLATVVLGLGLLSACGDKQEAGAGQAQAQAQGQAQAQAAGPAGPTARAPSQRKVGRGLVVATPPTFPPKDIPLGTLAADAAVLEHVQSGTGQRAAWRTREGEAFLDGAPLAAPRGGRSMRFSPNGQYFAYVSGTDDTPDEHNVVVGEVIFGPYTHVALQSIDDEGHVQFLAGPPGARVLVRDDVAGPTFTKIAKLDLVRAQPDGPVLAYRAATADQQCVVVAGTKACHRTVGRPVLSDDGLKTAHTASDSAGKTYAVVDGVRRDAEHLHIDWRLWIGNDGGHAYVAQQADGKRVVVLDGVPGKAYDRVARLGASADGKHIGYSVRDRKTWRVVTGTEAHADVGGEIKELVLAPQGGGWAAVVAAERGIRLVTADGPGPWFADVRWVRFSPDGQHLAYVGERSEDQGGGKAVVVVDGKISEAVSQAGDPRFLASGAVVYIAQQGAAWSIVAGERRWGPYDDIGVAGAIMGLGEHNYTLSADRAHVVFAGRKGESWHAVVDGVPGPPHPGIWSAPFSLELPSARVGYVAREASGVYWRMLPLAAPEHVPPGVAPANLPGTP